jgi:hypothetical protein
MRYRQTTDDFRPPFRNQSIYREGAVEVVQEGFVNTLNPIVSFTVMAHKKRQQWAEEIAAELNCDITWDRRNDRHDTGLRAIKAYDPDATHHVVIQDDVILCDNFKETVTNAIKYAHPFAPIGLYYGGKGNTMSAHVRAAVEADKNNACWIARKGPIWGPGIVYPVATIPDLMKYFAASIIENYDRRVMNYYQSVGQLCWYSYPSLVDHRQEDNPSLCGHDRGNRVARKFLAPQEALEMDWSGPVVKVYW